MDFSVGILEFPHIAEGYKNIDYIMKHFSISTLKLQRICPGRLLFIFSADTSDVVNIMKEYKDNKRKILYSSVTGISEKCIEALSSRNKVNDFSDLGIVEVKNCVNTIKVADMILKTSSSEILKIDMGLGLFGKGLVFFVGSISNIRVAIDTINDNFSKEEIISTEIISNPVDDFKKLFCY